MTAGQGLVDAPHTPANQAGTPTSLEMEERMRLSPRLASAVISGLALTSAITAQGGDNDGHGGGRQAFVGLWQAIDSFDGSTQFLSITCARDGACDVRLSDTAFTNSCRNQLGFAHGTGSIVGHVLTVDLTLHCSNLDGTSELAGTQENEFVLDRENGTLTNINDDPVPFRNVFHKMSK